MLQLPPVVKDHEWQYLRTYYKTIFFFDAVVLQNNKPLYIELDKIYRQEDDAFISILNNLRTNHVTKQDIENIEKQAEKSGVDRPMSIKIQKGSFDTPLKVNFYIKAGAGEKHTFLIDSKLITDLKAKQVY